MNCLEGEGGFCKETQDETLGEPLGDKLFLTTFQNLLGFWNFDHENLTWDKFNGESDSSQDFNDTRELQGSNEKEDSFTLPADSGNASAETSYLIVEDSEGDCEPSSHNPKDEIQHHGGRVAVLEFRSLQGLSVSHVIKHIEKMGSMAYLVGSIRTLFIQWDDVEFDERNPTGRKCYPFYRVFMVHFSCCQALQSLKMYETDFLVKHRFVTNEDNIRFIPSSPHWYVATPIPFNKFGNRELGWSRILPSDYHVNKGCVKFEFRRPLSISKVQLVVQKHLALLGQVEKFFSLIFSPTSSAAATKTLFSGVEKRQVLRNNIFSPDQQSSVFCSGVLVKYCDVRVATESQTKYMDIPQLDQHIKSSAFSPEPSDDSVLSLEDHQQWKLQQQQQQNQRFQLNLPLFPVPQQQKKVKPFSDLLFSTDTGDSFLLDLRKGVSGGVNGGVSGNINVIYKDFENSTLPWASAKYQTSIKSFFPSSASESASIMTTKAKIPTALKSVTKEKRHFLMAAPKQKNDDQQSCASDRLKSRQNFTTANPNNHLKGSNNQDTFLLPLGGVGVGANEILSLDNYVSFLEEDLSDFILKESFESPSGSPIEIAKNKPSLFSMPSSGENSSSRNAKKDSPSPTDSSFLTGGGGTSMFGSSSIWSSPPKDRSPIPSHPWNNHESSFLDPSQTVKVTSLSFANKFDPFRLPLSMSAEEGSTIGSGSCVANSMASNLSPTVVKQQTLPKQATPPKFETAAVTPSSSGETTSSSNNNNNNNLNVERYSAKVLATGTGRKATAAATTMTLPARQQQQSLGSLSTNEVNLDRIERGLDKRTTCMIRNIPNKYTQQMIINFINETHKGTYDFLYLRMDFKNRCNVGYAFINFTEPRHIMSFAKRVCGKKWIRFNSDKICSLSYANIQGKNALIEKFRNSSVMEEEPSYRPKIFYSGGALRGEEEPFPSPIPKNKGSCVTTSNSYSSSNPIANRRVNHNNNASNGTNLIPRQQQSQQQQQQQQNHQSTYYSLSEALNVDDGNSVIGHEDQQCQ